MLCSQRLTIMIQIDLQKAEILSGHFLHNPSYCALHLPMPEHINEATAAYMQRLLHPAERKKYCALFRNPRRQKLILFGRFFAKWMIADWVNEFGTADVMPPQIAVINRENGTPNICGLPDGIPMNISVSYSQNTFLIACATEGRIGVDIENAIDPDSNLSSLALSRQERVLMDSQLFGFSRAQIMLLFWCLKEAILKAVGLGFSHGYQSITFHTNSNRTQLLLADHDTVIPAGERIRCLFDMNDGLCAVICRIEKELCL